jgi:LacI family transcriptional regulator
MALRDSPELSRATCLKVQELARELDYTPNEAATKLATGRSGMLGLVYTRHGSAFNARILEALDHWAYQEGRYFNSLMTYSTRNRTDLLEGLLRRILQGRLVDGLIVASQLPSVGTIKDFASRRLPLVLMETASERAHSVRVDNEAGVEAAVRHLKATGRRKIGLVCGRTTPLPGHDPSRASKDRLASFRKAMEMADLPLLPKGIAEVTYYDPQEGRDALDVLLDRVKDLDAIFCAAGDNVAAGIHAQARKRGVKIPDDVALIGFDDQPIAALLSPRLSTVRQPFQEMAGQAWEILLQAIDTPDLPIRSVVLEPELVLRETS